MGAFPPQCATDPMFMFDDMDEMDMDGEWPSCSAPERPPPPARPPPDSTD